jgi:hypothetical protein
MPRYQDIPMKVQYTPSNLNEKKYTIQHAIDAATLVLQARNIRGVNMRMVNGRALDEKITLAELNLVSEAIVDTSHSRR